MLNMIYISCLDQERISRETVVTDIGTSIEISCNSYNQPTWTFNGSMLPINTVTTDKALYIHRVSYYHEGSYKCQGRTELHEKFMAKSRLRIVNKTKQLV